jgi:hypothetical protein
MITAHEEKVFKKAFKTWGLVPQLIKAQEECAELIQVLAKLALGKYNKKKIVDECADVRIMLDQIEMDLKIQDDTAKRRAFKVRRMEKRLSNG